MKMPGEKDWVEEYATKMSDLRGSMSDVLELEMGQFTVLEKEEAIEYVANNKREKIVNLLEEERDVVEEC